ncbi:MAG: hypothetical protein NWR87_01080, partial [Rhodospirillales bacterium]|nr:hypothetical protein [Rhodospirillales bacterium]
PNVLSADDLSDDQIEWQQPAAAAPLGGEDAMPAATPMPAAEPMSLLENEPQEAESIWDDPSFTGKKPKEKRPFSIGETAKLGGKGLAQSVTTEIPRMIGDAARFAGTYDSSIVEKSGQRIRETARGLGMPMMPQGAGQKAFPAESGDVAGIGTFGKDVSDWADEKAKQWYGEKPQDLNWVENAVYEGTKMLGPSLIPGGVLFKGAKILLGVGNTVKAAKYATETGNLIKSAELMAEAQAATKTAMKAASLGTAGLFGASQAQQTMDAANQKADLFEKQGKPEEAARMREIANGLAPILSGGIEAAGEYFGTKYLGKLFRLDEAEVIKRGAANLIKDFLKTLGVEVGTEMGQQAGEAAVEKYSGIRPEAEPLAEALEVVGPTIFMTILTAGTGAAYQRVAGQGKAGKADTVKVSEAAASLQKGIDDGTWTVDDVRAMRDKIKPDSPLYDEMSKVIADALKEAEPPEPADEFIERNKNRAQKRKFLDANGNSITYEEAQQQLSEGKDVTKQIIHDDDIQAGAASLSKEIGSQYDAHGIAKTDDFAALINLLDNGLEKGKNFYTDQYIPKENLGGITGAAAGAYKTGQFVLLSKKGEQLVQDGELHVDTVIVNESAYELIPDLQKRYPNIKFVRGDEQSAFFASKPVTETAAETPKGKRLTDMEAAII